MYDLSEIRKAWDQIVRLLQVLRDEIRHAVSAFAMMDADISLNNSPRQENKSRSAFSNPQMAEERMNRAMIQAEEIRSLLQNDRLASDRLASVLHKIRFVEEGVLILQNPWTGASGNPAFSQLSQLFRKVVSMLSGLCEEEDQRERSVQNPVDAVFATRYPDYRSVRFFHGDLTDTKRSYDVVCCSAFKGSYAPSKYSLIGALQDKKGISVMELAKSPELDMRDLGGWLSRPVDGTFKRILCVELTDWDQRVSGQSSRSEDVPVLQSAFLTLRNLLERAALQGTEIRRIALPILGAGYQDMDLEYIAPPLYTQCVNLFQTVPALESIDIYELNREKLQRLLAICKELSENQAPGPSVFISHSSVQADLAHSIWREMQGREIRTWIAPESIPTGSSYLSEIPRAISSIHVMLLLLTEEAQKSRWVLKEVSSAIGSGKLILPMQVYPFSLTPEVRFMLEGEQIHFLWEDDREQQIPAVVREVELKLKQGG